MLVVIGMALLCLPGVAALRPERLHPAQWAPAAAGALRAGLLTVRVGLFLGAAPTLLHAAGVEETAAACHRLFGPLAPGGPPTGWASAAAFAWLTLRQRNAVRAQRRAVERAQVEAWMGEHRSEDGIDVVTLAVDEPIAYAVPLGCGQVVVSDSLCSALDDGELGAVLAHERSHLANHHDRLVRTAVAAEAGLGWFPPVRRSVGEIRLAVERWADEDAAPTPFERALLRSALVKTVERMLSPELAFTGRGTVVDRLDALDRDPPRPTPWSVLATLAPPRALCALSIGVIGTWSANGEHGVLGLYRYCLS